MRGTGGSVLRTTASSHLSFGNTPPIALTANARAPRPLNSTTRAPGFAAPASRFTFYGTCVSSLLRLRGDLTPVTLAPCSACAPGVGVALTRSGVGLALGGVVPAFGSSAPPARLPQVLWAMRTGRSSLLQPGRGAGSCVTATVTIPRPALGFHL